MDETDLLAWIPGRMPGSDAVTVGCGPDDCGWIDCPKGPRAVSTDTVVAGRHFTPDTPPAAVGHKAVAAALSDLAASGCRPGWGLLALTLGRPGGSAWARTCLDAAAACAREHGLAIIGVLDACPRSLVAHRQLHHGRRRGDHPDQRARHHRPGSPRRVQPRDGAQ